VTEADNVALNKPAARRYPLWRAVLLCAASAIIAFGPALTQAWFRGDDLYFGSRPSNIARHCLANGRPSQLVWYYAAFYYQNAEGAGFLNFAARYLQLLLHTGIVLCAAYTVWNVFRSASVFLTLLPFMIWAFAGQAALWLAAGIYPLGAMLSMAGLLLLRLPGGRLRSAAWGAGCALIAVAFLTSQVGALSALVIWTIVLMLTALDRRPFPFRRLLREAAFMVAGLLMGALLSLWIAQAHGNPRASLAIDVESKLVFLGRLIKLMLFDGRFYPALLRWAHALSIALAIMAVFAWGILHRRMGMAALFRTALALVCLAACLVFPFAATLAVKENWPSWRSMYLGPMFLTACWVVSFRVMCHRPVQLLLAIMLVCLVILPHIGIARANTAAMVAVFDRDMHTLKRVEDFAEERGLSKVFVASYSVTRHVTTWNPYDLAYNHLQNRSSNFQIGWAAHRFLDRFSWLEPADYEGLRAAAVNACNNRHTCEAIGDGFHVCVLPGTGVVCVCPP